MLVVVPVVGTVVLIPSVEEVFFDRFSFFGITNTKIPVTIITKRNVTRNEITRIFLVFDISTLNSVLYSQMLSMNDMVHMINNMFRYQIKNVNIFQLTPLKILKGLFHIISFFLYDGVMGVSVNLSIVSERFDFLCGAESFI